MAVTSCFGPEPNRSIRVLPNNLAHQPVWTSGRRTCFKCGSRIFAIYPNPKTPENVIWQSRLTIKEWP